MMNKNVKISVESVYKIFGPNPQSILERVRGRINRRELLASTGHVIGVRNISLDIEAGKIFVIMGLSGSGKSTLVRHFNRLVEPTTGKITIDDINMMSLNSSELRNFRRKKIAMVFQGFALLPHKTVLENVAYGLVIAGNTRAVAYERSMEQIALVDLEGFENHYPDQLSSGMQQRVGLARALATDAEILLMDEAFGALDPLIRNDMQNQLKELQERLKKTIVFITHDLDEALRIGDHIAIMKEGELRQVGSGEDILLNPADNYIKRFVRDVNRARVVTVGSIAQPAPCIPQDEISLKRCSELFKGYESIIMTCNGQTKKIISRDCFFRFNGKSLELKETDQPDVTCINQNAMLEESFPMLANNDGIAIVMDNKSAPVGVVTRKTALGAMVGFQGQRV